MCYSTTIESARKQRNKMTTKTSKICTRCGVAAPHEQIGTEDCGRVWRCGCCFKTTPVRKQTRTEPQWKTDAKARIALALTDRS
jgi:hypothetical protein